jgi:hypothetical protein
MRTGDDVMGPEQPQEQVSEVEAATAGQFTGETGPGEASAWEEVSSGRYMPRRIKGSCKGRALG